MPTNGQGECEKSLCNLIQFDFNKAFDSFLYDEIIGN